MPITEMRFSSGSLIFCATFLLLGGDLLAVALHSAAPIDHPKGIWKPYIREVRSADWIRRVSQIIVRPKGFEPLTF